MCFRLPIMYTLLIISREASVEITALMWRHSLFHKVQKRDATCIVVLLRLYRATHTAPRRPPRVRLGSITLVQWCGAQFCADHDRLAASNYADI
jgi:hypothetical protein